MASELVRFNEETKGFEVSSQAVNVLRSLTGPICVVAVCGRARQGKSFLLNQLLARLQGPVTGPQPTASRRFAVGSTVKPCTKGLWLWSRPIPRRLPNGQTCHVLLLDAEGIDSYDQTADYSNHIFSLALLLSSVLVYNQMGSIDESSVEKLGSVCEFARLICGKADGGGGAAPSAATNAAGSTNPNNGGSGGGGGGGGRDGGGSNGMGGRTLVSEVSPAFVWLLRDFQLQLDQGGRQISTRDYMEEVLQELPGSSEAVRAKNQLRSSIKTSFPERECHALVRPLLDENRLARMDTLPVSELRPEFRKGLDSLVELLLPRCHPKILRGSALTGSALAALAESYCRVINEGGLPAITTTWQSVVQSECRRALDAAADLYRARLESVRAREVGCETLESVHTSALEAALELFNEQAIGETCEREPFLRRLREEATSLATSLRLTKRAEAEARAVELLGAQARSFRAAIREEGSDLAAAEARLHDFLREYGNDAGLGPDRYIRAAEFLAGTVVPELRRLAQEARSRAATAAGRVSELESKMTEVTQGPTALRSSLDAALAAEAKLRGELAAARSAEAAAVAEAAAARAAAAAAGKEAAAALREEVAAARVELAGRKTETAGFDTARLRSELAAAQAQLQAAKGEARMAAADRAALEHRQSALDELLASRTAEAESGRRAAEAARLAEAEARHQARSASAQLVAAEINLKHVQKERDLLQASLEQLRNSQAGAAMTATATAARKTRQAGAAAAAAAATPGVRRKRGRAAAGMDEEPGPQEVDAEMVDAGPSPFDHAGGGTCGYDGSDDNGVIEVEMAGTAAGTVKERQPARQRRAAATAAAAAAAAAVTPVAAVGGAGVGGEGTPYSVEREVLRTGPRGGASGGRGGAAVTNTATATPMTAAAAVATTPAAAWTGPTAAALVATTNATTTGSTGALPPALPSNLNSLKVDELKDWLTRNGWEGEVFARGRGRVTRKEWVDLVRARCAGGPPPQQQQQLPSSPPSPSPAGSRGRSARR